jgi:hypothetical protein
MRRPTRAVQRHDRHVPLYVGALSTRTREFKQLFSTGQDRTFATAKYEALFQREKSAQGPNHREAVDALLGTL